MAQKQHLGYVYFVLCSTTNLVKIGWSIHHPDKRLIQFRLGSGAELERFGFIRADQTLERRLHARFKHLREHGEWFRLEGDLSEFIKVRAQPWRPRTAHGANQVLRRSAEERAEAISRLVMEWSQKHCAVFARGPVEEVNFFEFCLDRGIRFPPSERLMCKVVDGKLVRYTYQYGDER